MHPLALLFLHQQAHELPVAGDGLHYPRRVGEIVKEAFCGLQVEIEGAATAPPLYLQVSVHHNIEGITVDVAYADLSFRDKGTAVLVPYQMYLRQEDGVLLVGRHALELCEQLYLFRFFPALFFGGGPFPGRGKFLQHFLVTVAAYIHRRQVGQGIYFRSHHFQGFGKEEEIKADHHIQRNLILFHVLPDISYGDDLYLAQVHIQVEHTFAEQPAIVLVKCQIVARQGRVQHFLQAAYPVLPRCFIEIKHAPGHADGHITVMFPRREKSRVDMGGVVGDHVTEIKLLPVDVPEIVAYRDEDAVRIDLAAEGKEIAGQPLTVMLYLNAAGKEQMRVVGE